MNSRKGDIYFVDGHVVRRDLVGVLAYLNEFAGTDAEYTRLYTYDPESNDWVHKGIRHEVVSVTYRRDNVRPPWYLLSNRGVVINLGAKGTFEENIDPSEFGPGSYGYVNQIRVIADRLYVCGMCRQVYTLMAHGWIHLDTGILADVDSVDYNFTSIDGTAPDDIYAVSWKGEIFHFNGSLWRRCDSPTNINLERVRCVSRDEVYIVGRSGVLLKGSGDRWQIIQDEAFKEHMWGLEIYINVPYIAWTGGFFTFDGSNLLPVDTGLQPPIDGARLHANGGVLWSFGDRDLAWFDGKTWTRVICPDNA